MKNLTLFFCCFIILTSAVLAADKDTKKNSKAFQGFEPYDPVNLYYKFNVPDGEGGSTYKDWKNLEQEDIDRIFCNEAVMAMVSELSNDGYYYFVPSTISNKNKNYLVYIDYMKFTSVPLKNEDGSLLGTGRMGMGLRIKLNIYAKEKGIVLSDLFSISMAVQNGKAYGSVSMEVIGLQSNDITQLLPLPGEINATSIQSTMQAMSTIKSRIYDSTTILSPQLIAVKLNPDDEDTLTGSIQDKRTGVSNALYGVK